MVMAHARRKRARRNLLQKPLFFSFEEAAAALGFVGVATITMWVARFAWHHASTRTQPRVYIYCVCACVCVRVCAWARSLSRARSHTARTHTHTHNAHRLNMNSRARTRRTNHPQFTFRSATTPSLLPLTSIALDHSHEPGKRHLSPGREPN